MIYDIVISDQAEIDLRGILEYIAFELQAPENASGQFDRLEVYESIYKQAKYTIAVENEVSDNMYQQSELDYLICNAPIGYADLVLNRNPEACLKTVTEYNPVD